jgi:hypothetical protein
VLEKAVVAQCAEMVGGARQVLEMTVVESHKLVPVKVLESHAGQGPVKAWDRIICDIQFERMAALVDMVTE